MRTEAWLKNTEPPRACQGDNGTRPMQPGCPRCGRRVVRRAPRAGALDRGASRLSIYPFRCQLCGRRFRAFTWGVRYTRRVEDRREYERLGVAFPARLVSRDDHASARITSLSVAGCLVETELRALEGAGVRLDVDLPEADRPVTVEGAVVRWAGPGMLGIEFVRMAADDKARLTAFVMGRLGLRDEHRAALDAGVAAHARRWRMRTTLLLLLLAIVVIVLVATLTPTFTLCPRGLDC